MQSDGRRWMRALLRASVPAMLAYGSALILWPAVNDGHWRAVAADGGVAFVGWLALVLVLGTVAAVVTTATVAGPGNEDLWQGRGTRVMLCYAILGDAILVP